MRTLLYGAIFLMVIAQGYWAYNEGYRTQKAMQEAQALQRQIASARARLGVLNAEWAYLNRPDRLRELANMNFDRLGLLALRPEQFGRVAEVPRPGLMVSDNAEGYALSALEGGE